MPRDPNSLEQEIAACAARLVVESGLEYGPAKRRALHRLGLPGRTPLPGNDTLEQAVREYLDVFCSATQPGELRRLREIALRWMTIMQEFAPFVSGAVWHGTATRHSDIHLQLFCDDPKAPEIALIERHASYEAGSMTGAGGRTVDVLTIAEPVPEWQQRVLVHMSVLDRDAVRGALKPDAAGRTPRGDARALQAALHAD